jgi:LuxR family maltose regulon positive regulatory protein
VQECGLNVDDELSYKRNLEHITLARILLAQARAEYDHESMSRALTLLERLLKAARRAKWIGKVIEISVLQAVAFMIKGDEQKALSSLYQSLILAEPEGYVRIFLDEGELLTFLLKALIEAHMSYANRMPSRIFAYANTLLEASQFDETGQCTVVPYPVSVHSVEPLTDREIEILNHICNGLSNREIAERLVISVNTVAFHTKNIYSKLKVNSRIKALVRAKDLGLL